MLRSGPVITAHFAHRPRQSCRKRQGGRAITTLRLEQLTLFDLEPLPAETIPVFYWAPRQAETPLLAMRPVQRRLWAPYQQDLIDFARFLGVRAARRRGLTWESAFKSAAQELERTPAFGSPAAMAKSYKRVSRVARAAPGRYALRPLAPEK